MMLAVTDTHSMLTHQPPRLYRGSELRFKKACNYGYTTGASVDSSARKFKDEFNSLLQCSRLMLAQHLFLHKVCAVIAQEFITCRPHCAVWTARPCRANSFASFCLVPEAISPSLAACKF